MTLNEITSRNDVLERFQICDEITKKTDFSSDGMKASTLLKSWIIF